MNGIHSDRGVQFASGHAQPDAARRTSSSTRGRLRIQERARSESGYAKVSGLTGAIHAGAAHRSGTGLHVRRTNRVGGLACA